MFLFLHFHSDLHILHYISKFPRLYSEESIFVNTGPLTPLERQSVLLTAETSPQAYFGVFETDSHYVEQASLKLIEIHLSPPPEC